MERVMKFFIRSLQPIVARNINPVSKRKPMVIRKGKEGFYPNKFAGAKKIAEKAGQKVMQKIPASTTPKKVIPQPTHKQEKKNININKETTTENAKLSNSSEEELFPKEKIHKEDNTQASNIASQNITEETNFSKFTSDQLLSLFNSADFIQKVSINTFLKILNAFSKLASQNKALKNKQEIITCIKRLITPTSIKPLTELNLAHLLACFVANKIKEDDIWSLVTKEILERRTKFTLEMLSYYLLCFKSVDFKLQCLPTPNNIFFELEPDVIRLLGKEEFNPKLLTKIIKAYAISANGSEDFFHIIERIIIDNLPSIPTLHLSSLVYYCSSCLNCPSEILKESKKDIMNRMRAKKPMQPKQVVDFAKAYANRDLLDVSMLKAVESTYCENAQIYNGAQISTLYSLFVKSESKYTTQKIWKYINWKLVDHIISLDMQSITELFIDWSSHNNHLTKEIREGLKNRILHLIESNNVEKAYLQSIYNIIGEEWKNEETNKKFVEKLLEKINESDLSYKN